MPKTDLFHLDTSFLVLALSTPGVQRRRLLALSQTLAEIEMSSLAWYEFSRGPRTPEQLAVGRGLLTNDGILALTEDLAFQAAEVFRQLGSPRGRASDILIGVTAALAGAVLLTENPRDFADIPGLRLG